MSTAFRHSVIWRVSAFVRAARDRQNTARATLTAVVLAFVLAAALLMPGPGGTNLAHAAIQRAKSLVELLHQRSPGKRTVAHLAMTKHKKVALHERALPKVRRRPPALAMAPIPPLPAEFPPAFVDLVAPPVPVQMASLEALPVGPFQLPGSVGGFFLSPPGGGLILPPGETPTSPPIVTPPVTITAVPEPGTWAMILSGFAMIGLSLRRTRRRERTAA
jgi:PEP-CTERM motif